MNVMAKVFGVVMNEKLKQWAEKNSLRYGMKNKQV